MRIRIVSKRQAQTELQQRQQRLEADIAKLKFLGKSLTAMRAAREYIHATMPPVREWSEKRENILTQLDNLLERNHGREDREQI